MTVWRDPICRDTSPRPQWAFPSTQYQPVCHTAFAKLCKPTIQANQPSQRCSIGYPMTMWRDPICRDTSPRPQCTQYQPVCHTAVQANLPSQPTKPTSFDWLSNDSVAWSNLSHFLFCWFLLGIWFFSCLSQCLVWFFFWFVVFYFFIFPSAIIPQYAPWLFPCKCFWTEGISFSCL